MENKLIAMIIFYAALCIIFLFKYYKEKQKNQELIRKARKIKKEYTKLYNMLKAEELKKLKKYQADIDLELSQMYGLQPADVAKRKNKLLAIKEWISFKIEELEKNDKVN